MPLFKKEIAMRNQLGTRSSRRLLLLIVCATLTVVALGAAAPNAAACVQCISETSEAYVFCQHHVKGTEYVGCNFDVTCGLETNSPQEIYNLECAG
jgi:hypothetical protein